MLSPGDPAPEFVLPSEEGTPVRLSDFRGKRIVLYFYPKDDTPGCTRQACDLRDHLGVLKDLGAVVLGVSPDSVASHARFREKYGLNFPLLSDEDHRVAELYGVWKEKNLYGKKTWGIERSTFLIDEHGRIREVWRRVDPKGHAERVRETLAGLN